LAGNSNNPKKTAGAARSIGLDYDKTKEINFMKRDMDLIRKILLSIEDHEEDTDLTEFNNLEKEGHSKSEIYYHIELLNEAGLIDATFLMGG